MSTFAVQARRITIRPHDNADALELAQVDDYLSVVPKGRYATGDLAVYVPEQSIVPEPIIEALGLTGRLAGPKANRVKAIRLRGVLSQGLLYQPEDVDLAEGQDYAEALGIVKWEPPVPTQLAGAAFSCPEIEPYTEIENLKRFPGAFAEGEPVVATEKLHGTCSIFTWDVARGELLVSSKGLAKKRLCLEDLRDERGRSVNAYWRMAHEFGIADTLSALAERLGASKVTLYGETLGIQDLSYGLQAGHLSLRVFDLRVDGAFLDADDLASQITETGLPAAPLIYSGPFSDSAIWAAASGMESVTGEAAHIREGIVIRPVRERRDERFGRLLVKAVSEEYLTRKDATEFE